MVNKICTILYDALIIGLIRQMTSTQSSASAKAAYTTEIYITTGAEWDFSTYWPFGTCRYRYSRTTAKDEIRNYVCPRINIPVLQVATRDFYVNEDICAYSKLILRCPRNKIPVLQVVTRHSYVCKDICAYSKLTLRCLHCLILQTHVISDR